MCCHGLISTSDSRFSLLSSTPPQPHLFTTPPQPHLFTTPPSSIRVSFNIHHHHLLCKPVSPIRTRVSSFKTKATINENRFVAEASALSEMSFYDLLGISESGSLLEIKQAYKQLARKYHPDVSPPGQSEEYTKRFIRVHEAYETLSDPRRRALYDRDMSRSLHLAFSARKGYNTDEGMEDKGDWKNRWQSQLSELKRRNMDKDARGNMSWGARMRRQQSESSDKL